MLVQNLSFRNITATGIDAIFSTYFQESTGVSDIAIRNNRFLGTNYVPKLYQSSVDGTNYYPVRNASFAMFGDVFSNYDGVGNEVTGIYPLFQQLDISGNTFQSVTGTGVFLTGIKDVHVDSNDFAGCAAVPDAEPLYSYYGSESVSALVLSFADKVSATGDVTSWRNCTARADSASSKNTLVRQ